jgi:homoserine O-acetyltransferase/O-succinyltransferase
MFDRQNANLDVCTAREEVRATPDRAGAARQGADLRRRVGRLVLTDGVPLDCGRTLRPVTVAYEQYGEMNADRSNVILVCHALSGGAHAAGLDDATGKAGWWDGMIGPGKAFDTSCYCVVSSNVLGSCYGTTGPASIDESTGEPYGLHFPVVTVRDMVRVQAALLDSLGVRTLAAVAGGSMGGMQALAWAAEYPQRIRHVIAIASTDRHSPRQIALNEVARRAVTGDPAWNGGRYYPGPGPREGLAVGRMLGHITYLSDAGMERKFGRRLRGAGRRFDLEPQFEVEHYLRHQGEQFVARFDANALLYLTSAIDHFDLSEGTGSAAAAVSPCQGRFLLLTFSSDWLYPPGQLARVAKALREAGKAVTYRCIDSDRGHDAFLLEHETQAKIVRGFLDGD